MRQSFTFENYQMPLSYGSVCSGIEAASVAWDIFGFRPAWFAEIEAGPSAILAARYPKVINLGDMTKIAQYVRLGMVEAPDILVGGTPCQAFSVAGVRAGLADPRGQLTLSYADLADAIDEQRPGNECVIKWENVPGVLSDKTNAFGCFLALLAGESTELVAPGGKWPNAGIVLGPKRAIGWRVIDAQYFGVAQRRRRVYLVASARAGFDPAKLLFEFDGVRRDIAPSRETGQTITHDVAPCLTSSGRGVERTGETRGQDPVAATTWPAEIAPCLDTQFGTKWGQDNQHINNGTGLFVPVPLRMAHGQAGAEITSNFAPTLTTVHEAPITAYAFQDDTTPKVSKELNYTLRAEAGGQGPCVAYAHRDIVPTVTGTRVGAPGPNLGRREGDTVCITGDITHTLKAEGFDASEDGTGRGQPIVAAFAENSRGEIRFENGDGSRTGALSTGGGKPGQGMPTILSSMAGVYGLDSEQNGAYELMGTLKARVNGGGVEMSVASPTMAVRRLTPRECERLQGFPDDYTLIFYKGKPISDSVRYKALGNSMAVPCMRWVAARLLMTHPELVVK